MNHPQPGYDRANRPNFFLLFVLGAMALFLYSQYQQSKQQAAVPEIEITIPDISNDGKLGVPPQRRDRDWRNPTAKPNPTNDDGRNANDDWSLDTEVSTHSSGGHTEPDGKRADNEGVVRRGDWSLETGASQPSIDRNAKPLGPAKAKTTREGDWSLGEVEIKK